jgi:aspartyl-tRNA(Asn)/glutamyl-tRNA(Gln) amidotransferase subunit A
MDLNKLTIKEARFKLDQREISSLELTEACLKQINKLDKGINACLLVCAQEARKEAKQADARLKQGEKGNLLGIPYLCKDNLMTKGIKTTAASKMLENYVAPYDARVIKKLKEAGAVLLGKTNLDEFAHGASTENSAFFPTKNPHDYSRVAGGSSGGSAAAVATDMCLFALGSDTGGSIRQPASFCGVVGLKPSYGRVSRFGLLSMTSSTDVVGPITKTIEDAEFVFAVISGHDNRDATTASDSHIQAAKNFVKHASSRLSERENKINNISKNENKLFLGIKIGLPQEYFSNNLDANIKEKIKNKINRLKELGAKVININLPHTKYGIPVYYIITPSEISSNLARFDGIGWGLKYKEATNLKEFYKKNRGFGFGPEVKRRIMLGTYALSAGYYDAYYKKAQAVRTLIIKDFNQAFKKVDFILTPTSPHPAFKLKTQIDDPLVMYLEDIFVTGASLAGLPALSMPAGKVLLEKGREMPIGLQLIAPRFFDEELIAAAKIIEDGR